MRAPAVPYNTTPYSTSVFAPPTTTPIFAKLPKRLRFFHFWARTRMVQRGLMICLVLWIFLLVYNSGLVEQLTENTTQIASSFAIPVPHALQSLISPLTNPSSQGSPSSQSAEQQPLELRLLQPSFPRKTVPDQHWTSLFGYYNISLLRRYISILPPIQLGVPVSPSVSLQWRHPAEADPTLRSYFLAYVDRLPEEEEDSGVPLQSTSEFLLSLNYRPSTWAELAVISILALPTVIFIIYLLVLLYRCICPRHYAEWRSSWKRGGAVRDGVPPQNQDLDPDAYLVMETLPLKLRGHSQEIEEICSDKNILCSVCLAGDVRVWDTMSGECLTTINRSAKWQGPLASFPSESTCCQPAEGELPRPVFQWTQKVEGTGDHRHSADSGMSSPTGGAKGQQNHFEAGETLSPGEGPQGTRHFSPLEFQPVWCMATRNSWLVLGCSAGRIELWDAFTGFLLHVYNYSSIGVTHLCLAENRLYVARFDGVVEFLLVDVCENSPEDDVHPPIDVLDDLELQPNRNGQAVQLIWLHSLRAHTTPITILRVFGGHLLTAGQDHIMKVFYCDTGTFIYTLHGHTGPISAFHVDQASPSWAASGCQDGLVCVWDLLTGMCLYNRQAHKRAVLALATTPCYMVTLGANSQLGFWEKTQGHLLHYVRHHRLCPELALLTNNILVTARQNRLVLWDINCAEEVREVCLDSEELHLRLQRLRLVGRAIVCSSGSQLTVVHFPAMTEKGD